MIVRSSDGVDVVVHDLGGQAPATLLLCHATGFHGRCFAPLADSLADRFHAVAPDLRGHGLTAAPPGWQVGWDGYTDDVVAVADELDAPMVAFGHSMGGACLLLAAHRRPELFARLVLFEPIVFPPSSGPASDLAPRGRSLAETARRRRSSFPSLADAMANYASKPPMSAFAPEALRAYVEHGFVAADGPGEGVRLRCDPQLEADTFEAGPRSGIWPLLAEIETPVLVISGRPDGPPATLAPSIAGQLPAATHLQLPGLDHFGPMTAPAEIARIIAG